MGATTTVLSLEMSFRVTCSLKAVPALVRPVPTLEFDLTDRPVLTVE